MTRAIGAADADVVGVIGGGPAGLTAALELLRAGRQVVVLEAAHDPGGLSKTHVFGDWAVDAGGHRFMTKSTRVARIWSELLPPSAFREVERRSAVLIDGRYFDYPLTVSGVARNLPLRRRVVPLLSLARARSFPPEQRDGFDGWMKWQVGAYMHELFFKPYTEKTWCCATADLPADWAKQRIRVPPAFRDLVRDRSRGTTAARDVFYYPRRGPGMVWDAAARRIEDAGGRLCLDARVTEIEQRRRSVRVTTATGSELDVCALISSVPLVDLVAMVRPTAPPRVRSAAARLEFRHLIVVPVVVPAARAAPYNWVYVPSRDVATGRIQNYAYWSKELIASDPALTCLGLEYYTRDAHPYWSMTDKEVLAMAAHDLEALRLPSVGPPLGVIRVHRAYPVPPTRASSDVAEIRRWLEQYVPAVQTVGRNGMHQYLNQDHAMLAGIAAVERVVGSSVADPWDVHASTHYQEDGLVTLQSEGEA